MWYDTKQNNLTERQIMYQVVTIKIDIGMADIDFPAENYTTRIKVEREYQPHAADYVLNIWKNMIEHAVKNNRFLTLAIESDSIQIENMRVSNAIGHIRLIPTDKNSEIECRREITASVLSDIEPELVHTFSDSVTFDKKNIETIVNTTANLLQRTLTGICSYDVMSI